MREMRPPVGGYNWVMDPDRLAQQLRFIVELDKLKAVLRRTILIDRSRNENTAEHSWHAAMAAALLVEYADEPVNLPRVIEMLLVHDVIEIDAGDTYCYDPGANVDKAQREKAAAERLFALLPDDQREHWRGLWEEFEAMSTPDSRYANAIDRVQPLLNNYYSEGEAWRAHGVTKEQVLKRMSAIDAASRSLGRWARDLVEDAARRGFIGGPPAKRP